MIGRVAYAALFVAVWPAYLVALGLLVDWPGAMRRVPEVGWPLAVAGLGILVAGIAALWRRGGSAPMNAYPPPRLVTTGIYRVVPHPIYVGFCAAVAGVALALGSASGLVLGVPLSVVGSAALVLGHERRSLLARFGALPRPLLGPGRLAPAARALRLDQVLAAVIAGTQRLANAWAAWRVGRVRIVNHVVFSGLAGGVGAAGAVLASGGRLVGLVAALMVVGAVGAALLGQVLVGSSGRLSRPFGYFGGLAAIAVVGGVAAVLVPDATTVLAAFALAAPPTQALGRLRCLVQGCCHGEPTTGPLGIVVTNPHSRACALAGLGGRPLHPTQLYSLVGNLLLAPALVALWQYGAPQPVVIGCYLVGAGAIRFVEEAYRGEPATAVWRGLHSYQWFALAMVIGGLALLLVPGPATPPLTLDAGPQALAAFVVFFVFCGAALSVDLPDSTARFSRLSG